MVRGSLRAVFVRDLDAFPDDDGRQADLSGEVAQALGENTGELFEQPTIEQVGIVAEKSPQ